MMKRITAKAIIFSVFHLYIALSTIPVYSQDGLVAKYMEKAGENAALYRGEIEYVYSPYIYKSQPYFVDSEFATGDLYYDGRYYPGQRLRLDTYKDQLLILTPRNQSIILDSRKFQKALIHGKELIYHVPSAGSGLKTGYYISLYNGENMWLLAREKHDMRILPTQIEYIFDKNTQYYVLYKGKYTTVKNKRSFTRLFPALKKQINQYAKSNKLNFKLDREQSLTILGQYCDQLINTQTHTE